MNKSKVAKKAAKIPATALVRTVPADRGESPALLEPMILPAASRARPELTDLVLELASRSTGFTRSLSKGFATALADLVRSMNCYYSNLIEGHDTHPVDIEKALQNDYSRDPNKRNLQHEAKAHIEVQRWIDSGGLHHHPTTRASICEIHRRFCAALPDELLTIENPDSHERMRVVPGELRTADVAVGQHIPVSAGAVPRFLDRFEQVYTPLGRTESILAAAAAHHRFAWIHPFLDGNGRVVRLMSHATLLDSLDTGSLWSVSRGLGRNVADYKRHLVACDQARRNDLDGRGNLSEEALVEFTRFFLNTCIDQVKFMESLIAPDRLRARVLLWADEETKLKLLHPKAKNLLEALLYRGEVPRGEAPHVIGTSASGSRRIVNDLAKYGAIRSASPYGPLRLALPATLAPRWLPGLFPDKKDEG
jgi:Fic family protein